MPSSFPSLRPRARTLARTAARAVALLAAGLCAGQTHAADVGVGLLAGGGANGRVDCLDGFACDHGASYWKAAVSYRVYDPIELQLAYFQVGDLKGPDTTPLGTKFGGTFKLSGVALTAGYRWAVMPWLDVTARGGIADVRARFAYDAPFSGEPSKTSMQPYSGLNVDWVITPSWRVGFDYAVTRENAHVRKGTVQLFGVSAQFNF